MIISDRYRFVFVHIPKCAGSSVREVLRPFDDTHGKFEFYVAEHPDFGELDFAHIPMALLVKIDAEALQKVRDYDSFAIVRNPYDRFPSAVAQRAKMYLQKELAQLEPAALAQEVESCMQYLRDRTLITDPGYIHFARQTNYVDFEGERIVNNIFPVERLDAFRDAVAARVDSEIGDVGHVNRAVTLRFSGIRPLVTTGSSLAKRLLPNSLSRHIRNKARQFLVRPIETNLPPIFQSGMVKDFVRDYYAGDIALHKEALASVNAKTK